MTENSNLIQSLMQTLHVIFRIVNIFKLEIARSIYSNTCGWPLLGLKLEIRKVFIFLGMFAVLRKLSNINLYVCLCV